MGLVATGSPELQDQVARFQPQIMAALQKATSAARERKADAHCATWFGDSSGPFMGRLSKALSKMRSIINTQRIDVVFAPLSDRSGDENAAAYAPAEGWAEYLDFAQAEKQGFTLHLNENFRRLPLYCTPSPAQVDGQSQFETLVHELSHLILGTDDELYGGYEAYGAKAARDLAKASSYKAKNNAENWGLFVESFRV
jgi:hypothetical protein